ncbi:MAG: RHS repeat-associated core domain-containing protein, partial [Burkholderiales bacterium]
TGLSHDANGNLLGFGGDTYTWNKRDQLSAISGTNTGSFQYDAVGRRQAKTLGSTTQFLYDGLNPIQEKSGSTITASLLTGLGVDQYFARTEGSATQHFLTDALGSTVRLTDGSAVKIVDYTYEAYGNTSADAATTNAFQYTGRENDGTGLNYYRARYQHPVLGRFISEDPIGLEGGENLYSYVFGDPVSLVDPSGLQVIVEEDPGWGRRAPGGRLPPDAYGAPPRTPKPAPGVVAVSRIGVFLGLMWPSTIACGAGEQCEDDPPRPITPGFVSGNAPAGRAPSASPSPSPKAAPPEAVPVSPSDLTPGPSSRLPRLPNTSGLICWP